MTQDKPRPEPSNEYFEGENLHQETLQPLMDEVSLPILSLYARL